MVLGPMRGVAGGGGSVMGRAGGRTPSVVAGQGGILCGTAGPTPGNPDTLLTDDRRLFVSGHATATR